MAGLSRIRIGMAVLDRTGALIGVVKALELAQGVKPSPDLVLDGAQARRMLAAGVRCNDGTHTPSFKGRLVIETPDGDDVVESLDSIHRVADTAVHLAVVRRVEKSGEGSLEGV